MRRWIVYPFFCCFIAFPVNAVTLADNAKVTNISLGIFGLNVVQISTQSGAGPCSAISFFPRYFPYQENYELEADRDQFDRMFALLVTAYITGFGITVEGESSSCFSGYSVKISH